MESARCRQLGVYYDASSEARRARHYATTPVCTDSRVRRIGAVRTGRLRVVGRLRCHAASHRLVIAGRRVRGRHEARRRRHRLVHAEVEEDVKLELPVS